VIPSVFAVLLILAVLAIGAGGIFVLSRLVRRAGHSPASGTSTSTGASTDTGARA
jgi:hypothetical protein